MIEQAFDLLLCLMLVGIAGGVIFGRDPFLVIALFVTYGLLLSLAWVRLEAIDVALAEAAIGAGLTGILLLSASSRLRPAPLEHARQAPLALLLCLCTTVVLVWAAVSLGARDVGLSQPVRETLARSGVENPVTAVLLNFRGWDTLLESMVLAVALISAWALAPEGSWGNRPGLRQHLRGEGVLESFGRFLAPLGLIVGIYLVWTGTSAPGGAFQAGTVLAAVWLLAMMAGLAEPPAISRAGLRVGLVAGPFLFLLVGFLGLSSGAFLSFPVAHARTIILAVELAIAFSVAVTLSMLVLGWPKRTR